ncbi:recombinase family protein [Nocardia wallacei]|uniref:recombinase family protein n=1 Tax=Nocardia wallacei TaxID=480035 RepID=UPI002458329F|nr:recombinase family protein [Nocardia wallacei]
MRSKLRAVVGARVSVLKGDQKVSHVAQHETGGRWAQTHDATIVGTFEDLDVSATVSPFERPDLGKWFSVEREHEWDVLIWSKIDRAFRDPRDSVNVTTWAEERKKVLVFADDGLVLDFRDDADPMARMMAETFLLMGSIFAKWELKRFQSRAVDAHRVLRHTDRFAGGTPPEGFTTAPHPSGKGRALVQDPVRQRMLHDCARLLLVERQSFNGIRKWLNTHYETATDYHRAPEKKRGGKWSAAQVIDMLTSPGTQGLKLSGRGRNSRVVLDENGHPIRMGPATFDDATWDQIQIAVQERKYGPKTRVNGASPLGDVVYCGKCKRKARHRITRQSYGEYRYYNCGNVENPCVGVNSRAGEVEQLMEETFLDECGAEHVKRRQFVPAEDHTQALEKVNTIINALREDREMGLIVGEEDETRFRAQMRSLLTQRTQLEALPQKPARWELVEEEETYGEQWARSDTEGRRQLLVDAGVRIELCGGNQWDIYIPEDIRTRLADSRHGEAIRVRRPGDRH